MALFRGWLVPVAILLALFPSNSSAACYYPSGKLAPNDTPCRDDTSDSVCCGQGYACLSNGICQATGAELLKPGATEFVRGGCTDKTWRSSSCPSFCVDTNVDNLTGGMGIAKCPNTSKDMYWCINKNQGSVNCTAQQNVLFFPGTPTAITTIGVSPSTTSQVTSTIVTSSTKLDSTATSTSATTATSEATTTSEPRTGGNSNDNDKGPIIGGAVGGAFAILLIGSLVIWLVWRHRRRRARTMQEQTHQLQEQTPKSPYETQNLTDTQSRGPYEAPTESWTSYSQSTGPLVEISGAPRPQEMPTSFNMR
ncbi:unnamed protein product [Clonostachys byssicola]|uniref:Mid2 domain-containing protein n=1 Tax=Clonostachys byssicola TaxID=160290 RepID=A0A9N9XX98_9HYPO|nr:unnamed protein product [Clonostachys byssicola]